MKKKKYQFKNETFLKGFYPKIKLLLKNINFNFFEFILNLCLSN